MKINRGKEIEIISAGCGGRSDGQELGTYAAAPAAGHPRKDTCI